jgi:hypothetical protein
LDSRKLAKAPTGVKKRHVKEEDAAAVLKGCCLQGDMAFRSGVTAAAFGVGTYEHSWFAFP